MRGRVGASFRYQPGSTISRLEVLHGQLWMEHPVTVVFDDGDELAVLLEPGSRFRFHPHPNGTHPWGAHESWQGPQVLQVHRPGDLYSVWLFFDDGVFRNWYVNFETPFVRHDGAFDTHDYGLDLIINPDGSTMWKDVEHLNRMRSEGRMTLDEIGAVLEAAELVTQALDRGDRWWARWDDWSPAS